MMFLFHSAMGLSLIAIALGVMLVVWSLRNEGKGVQLAKVFGILIVIVAIFGQICSTYYSLKYWSNGYFESPAGMMHMQNNSKCMGGMDNMMQKQ